MEQELLPHLFRKEFSKIAAVLCKHMGIDQLAAAEDIASDTFLQAMETWGYKGIPENPAAWLYTVAKNKAKNYHSRNQLFNTKISARLKQTTLVTQGAEIDWSDEDISDSQLQTLFAICHPAIPAEAQIGLALRILGGFGIDEIADAFLTSKETVNKRLFRAREKLRHEKITICFPPEKEIESRLQSVLTTVYLLFNEGYYSESRNEILRNDCCLEAMRLTYLLTQNNQTNQPPVNALLALMCFHASRFEARKDNNGAVILYDDQDEKLWNQELISRGSYFLHQASQGNTISTYHLEANIAWWHTVKDTHEKWENILQLYNHLLQISYSPVAALNRTYALARANGNAVAIREAEKLCMENNHYYFTLLGELYKDTDVVKAREHFEKAMILAKTTTDRDTLQTKLDCL